MKMLVAALTLAGSLVAAQAHAAVFDFSFSDSTLIPALSASSSATTPSIVASSPVYNFSLDTSTATGNGTAGSAIFSNVNIYNGGNLLGTDTIRFSLTSNAGIGTAATAAAVTSAPAPGSRVLTATGAYAFEFDPAVFAVGGATTGITFTPGVYGGEDTTHGVNATIIVSPSAVSAAPEPGAWALMLGGVAMLGAMLRIRKARRDEDAVSDIATA